MSLTWTEPKPPRLCRAAAYSSTVRPGPMYLSYQKAQPFSSSKGPSWPTSCNSARKEVSTARSTQRTRRARRDTRRNRKAHLYDVGGEKVGGTASRVEEVHEAEAIVVVVLLLLSVQLLGLLLLRTSVGVVGGGNGVEFVAVAEVASVGRGGGLKHGVHV